MRKLYRTISWSALFAAATAGVGVNFLLNLLMLALGVACFSVSEQGHTYLSMTGFMGFCLSAVLAMFMTGWFAGRLTPRVLSAPYWGLLHGFLAWSLLLMLTIIIITNMIQYTAFHTNFTSNLVEIKLTAQAPMWTTTHAQQIEHSPLSFNIETHKKIIVLNAALTFFLFFLGATASCIGGYVGYQKSPKVKAITL